jgi:hypothetical protein
MKQNRSKVTTILVIVLVICTGILLNGCASTGGGKNAEPKQEPTGRSDNRNTVATEASGSSPEVQEVHVVNTGVSGEKPPVQAANIDSGKDRFKDYAAYLGEVLERILPASLPDINWNRIATVLTGMLMILMIYGLAFGLGRLPLRRQDTGRHAKGRQTGQHAGGSVSQ